MILLYSVYAAGLRAKAHTDLPQRLISLWTPINWVSIHPLFLFFPSLSAAPVWTQTQIVLLEKENGPKRLLMCCMIKWRFQPVALKGQCQHEDRMKADVSVRNLCLRDFYATSVVDVTEKFKQSWTFGHFCFGSWVALWVLRLIAARQVFLHNLRTLQKVNENSLSFSIKFTRFNEKTQ